MDILRRVYKSQLPGGFSTWERFGLLDDAQTTASVDFDRAIPATGVGDPLGVLHHGVDTDAQLACDALEGVTRIHTHPAHDFDLFVGDVGTLDRILVEELESLHVLSVRQTEGSVHGILGFLVCCKHRDLRCLR